MMTVLCDQCGNNITDEEMVLVEKCPAMADLSEKDSPLFHFCSMAHLAEWIEDQPEEAPEF